MSNEPQSEEDLPEPRPGRRVFFVRLDRPEAGQGPHWVGHPAIAENPDDKTGSTSALEPGSSTRMPTSPPGSVPATRVDNPLPLAASARPGPSATIALAPVSPAPLATSTLPASTLPASTLPASTLPASTLPASTLPIAAKLAEPHFAPRPLSSPPLPEIPSPQLAGSERNRVDAQPTDEAGREWHRATPAPHFAPQARSSSSTSQNSPTDLGAGDDPLHTHARQLVLHLKSRHRELRRRQRALDQREAELSVQPAVIATAVPDDERAASAERATTTQAAQAAPDHGSAALPREAPSHPTRDVVEQRLRERESELLEFAERLRRREEDLDRERTALDQMRNEVTARNQEALEMRLACEQLWSQLASRMEAPRLVESIAQLRRKLADQFDGAARELAEQRDEVRQLITRLDDRHKQLRRQREEVQAWVMRRHEELEIQQIQLLKKQQELDAREREQQRRHFEIQQQISEYQRTIRQLQAQLRCKHELSQLPS